MQIKLTEGRILSGKDLWSYKDWVNATVPWELGKIPKLEGHSQDWGECNSSSQVSPFVLAPLNNWLPQMYVGSWQQLQLAQVWGWAPAATVSRGQSAPIVNALPKSTCREKLTSALMLGRSTRDQRIQAATPGIHLTVILSQSQILPFYGFSPSKPARCDVARIFLV